MDTDLVKKLAGLSRLELDEEETQKMAHDIGSILEYVDQVKNAVSDAGDLQIESTDIRNVFREDADFGDSGKNTEKILASAPAHENNQIKVKKIL